MGSSLPTALRRRKRKRVALSLPGPLARAKGPPWKLLGLAGIAGVAATGVVVARSRRAHRELPPDELRERLHSRLAQVRAQASTPAGGAGDADPPSAP